MINIDDVRTDREAVKRALKGRGGGAIDDLFWADEQFRLYTTKLQAAENERNNLNKAIGDAYRLKLPAEDLKEQAKATNEQIDHYKKNVDLLKDVRDSIWAKVPNIPHYDVPEGGEENNLVVHQDDIPEFDFEIKEHHLLPGFNFEQATKIAGTRFNVMTGTLAKLHRVIGQFMIDHHVEEYGFTEVDVPYLVNQQTMFGTGQLPKFEEDLFKTVDGRYLIPTGEVPMTNLVANQILDYGDLPLRMVGLTPCFRAEAGSAGRDTHGLIRQHQFHKVEMVTISTPDQSGYEHQHMLNAAEMILKKLDLPFRRVLLAAGDMGFGARKTYDLEVWLPGQKAWREISSISNCGDFQARRMAARVKLPGDKKTTLVHTLNGSGLAVGRTLVAILENYQQPDGWVAIPEILQPYFPDRIIL
ncbi:MAG: serine--tRNA ligase [Gammaproteobacteria bacterium]|nr:serine--tRNA ligase [Gammaproteobacteria bacterium]